MTELLRVEHLVKRFPSANSRDVVSAVNDVSFHLNQAETLGLVGESGSGKTTVGRCVLRLLQVTAGRIVFRGQDITTLSEKDFRPMRFRLQLVFQDPADAMNPRMPVGDIIAEPLRLEGRLTDSQRRERVRELAGMVRLAADDLERFPHQISGSQQQRVGIARAIATNPDVVVLDEPTSSLDISIRAEIIDLLIRLQREVGLSYLFISHDLTAVRQISHRVAVMYLGQIVEAGPTRTIFEQHMHPYTRALLSSVLYPDPDRRLPPFTLSGEIPSPINLPNGCYLASRCPMVRPACMPNMPALVAIAPDHYVACLRAQEPTFRAEMKSVTAQLAGGTSQLAPVVEHG